MGSPPSAKEIAAARISSSARQYPNPQHHRNNGGSPNQRSASLRHSTGSATKAPLGDSHSPNIAALNGAHYLGWTVEEPPSSSSHFADVGGDGPARSASARVRSFTYSAGDLDEDSLPAAPPVKASQEEEQTATGTGTPGDNGQMDVDPGGGGASSKTTTAETAEAVDAGKRRCSGSNGSGNPKVTGSGSGSGSESGAGGEQGWKAVDLLEDAALFGVFDGHGGKAVAEFARDRLPGKIGVVLFLKV